MVRFMWANTHFHFEWYGSLRNVSQPKHWELLKNSCCLGNRQKNVEKHRKFSFLVDEVKEAFFDTLWKWYAKFVQTFWSIQLWENFWVSSKFSTVRKFLVEMKIYIHITYMMWTLLFVLIQVQHSYLIIDFDTAPCFMYSSPKT